MKSVILISSIFYFLGLKIGHKIDLFKNHEKVEKLSLTKDIVKPVPKSVHFNDELNLKKDTLLNCDSPAVINNLKVEKSHL